MTGPISPPDPEGSADDGGVAAATDQGRALAAVTAERDAALAASFRQRERLQEQIDLARARAQAKDQQLRRTRAQLESARRRIGFRIQRAMGRAARAVMGRSRGSGEAPASAAIDASPVPPAGVATEFRERTLARLSGSTTIDGAIRVLVLGGTGSGAEAARQLEGLGMEATAADGLPAGSAGELAIDVILLLGPPAETAALPAGAITIAWVGDQADRWIGNPALADLDIVLVADEATGARIEAETPKSAWIGPDPATAAGARAVRDALVRWVTARHVAIHIGPLTWEAAAAWGDLPFGRDVQKAFERRGWPATVHVFDDRDSPAAVRADVALHIFGVRAPEVRRGQTSVLWIISHPDFVRRELSIPYDLVAVASDRFLGYLRGWLGDAAPPMLPLHQATDPDRFHPEPGGPAHDLLFVGSSRNVRRPILDALAGTSHDLAVYGRKWTPELLDPRYLRGEWIPNDELRRYYSSSAIVLNDSWADMRDEGFIANRIYDALASGAFVISEAVPGLDDEFDGSVVSYRDREELLEQVDHYLARPAERAGLAETGRRTVLERHTFGHRVAAIIDAVEPLLAAGESDGAAMGGGGSMTEPTTEPVPGSLATSVGRT